MIGTLFRTVIAGFNFGMFGWISFIFKEGFVVGFLIVGGFNMIDSQTESDLVTFLREHKDSHPYTLDLLQNKLMLKHKGENLEIDLNALKAELVSLQEKVKAFQHKMSAITLI